MKNQEQILLLTNFLNKFTLSSLDQETKIIRSSANIFLVKQMQFDSMKTDIDVILDTLEQHQALNPTYILPLLNYQVTSQVGTYKRTIRTLYQYAKLNLQEEIKNRGNTESYFMQEQLWAILYSVVKALEYLQKLKIGYGVLGCDKIFLQEKIKLIDPSAIAQDPFAIIKNRLYSPEIINGFNSVDILKSDVYVLGLCMLQAALLLSLSGEAKSKHDDTKIKIYLDKIEQMYGSSLASLLRKMLSYNPDSRPTFSEIREYLQNNLDMTEDAQDNYYQPLPMDQEDHTNFHQIIEAYQQIQNFDIQQEDLVQSISSSTDYETAKSKFFREEKNQKSTCSREGNSQNSSVRSIIQIQKKRISKSIKEKVIKSSQKDLQVVHRKSFTRFGQQSNRQDSQLYTNPVLMAEIKNKLNRNELKNKENIYKNY